MSPTTIFAPVSTPAAAIVSVSTLVLGAMALVFLCVGGLFTYVVVRFRSSFRHSL